MPPVFPAETSGFGFFTYRLTPARIDTSLRLDSTSDVYTPITLIRLKAWIMLFLTCALVASADKSPVEASSQPAVAAAIEINPAGKILRDGRPYRALGINYFSAFSRTLENPADTSYRQGFDVLARYKIPFIRFMACGFSPSDWKLYQEDKAAYFKRMDAFVRTAEEKHIGLIPSLFWWCSCIPNLVGEPRGAYGNLDSKTIAFVRQYTRDVVGHYAKSQAIWAWELGNEYSLEADLPKPAANDLSHDQIVTVCREFARAVRAVDAHHLITTGHSLPRPSAEHLRYQHTWGRDSREEFMKNLLDCNPAPNNLISVHLYPFDTKDRFPEGATTYEEILSLCLKAAAESGKALFVGEFGAGDTVKEGGPDEARKQCLAQIAAIESSGVALAALWVFDLPNQESSMNVSPNNHRAYLLDELMKANERLLKAANQP